MLECVERGERDCADGTLSDDVRRRRRLFFSGFVNSYVKRSMMCVSRLAEPALPHGSDHSGSSGGPMNLLPLQGWSSLDKQEGDVGL